jgi:hypothetical protein
VLLVLLLLLLLLRLLPPRLLLLLLLLPRLLLLLLLLLLLPQLLLLLLLLACCCHDPAAHAKGDLLLLDVRCTGSCECAMHPTTHSTSPDAMPTPARQYPLPLSSSHPHTLTCITRASLSQGHIGATDPAPRTRQTASASASTTTTIPPPARRLSRSATSTGRVGRCGPRTCPCESLPGARSLTARSAVQQLAFATAAVVQPPKGAVEAAQPKPRASSSPQRAPMRSRSTSLTPGMWRMVELASEAQHVLLRARWDRLSGWAMGGGH